MPVLSELDESNVWGKIRVKNPKGPWLMNRSFHDRGKKKGFNRQNATE